MREKLSSHGAKLVGEYQGGFKGGSLLATKFIYRKDFSYSPKIQLLVAYFEK